MSEQAIFEKTGQQTTSGLVVVVTRQLRGGRMITRHTALCQRCYPQFVAVASGRITRQYAPRFTGARCAFCGSGNEEDGA